MNRTSFISTVIALLSFMVGLVRGFTTVDIWMIAGTLGFGLLIYSACVYDDTEAVFEGIRKRDGALTWRAVINHIRGISPYTSTEPSELARAAAQRIFPDGKTMSEEEAAVLFGQGSLADVRAGLGYPDGKTWFEEAPSGLLVAEMMSRIRNEGESDELDHKRRNRVKESIKEYHIIACTFARPDLLSAILLEEAGCLERWAPATDVLTAQRTLPVTMLDLILQVVPADVLNESVKIADDYIKPWTFLFERLETEPKTYEKVLARFAEAGVDPDSIGRIGWEFKTIRNRRRLEAAVKKVKKTAKALQLTAMKADIIEKANAVVECKVVVVETQGLVEATASRAVNTVTIEATETTDAPVEKLEASETELIETYVATEATGVAWAAVERICPDGRTFYDEAVYAMFGRSTTASVRKSLGYADGRAWFEEAPGALLVAELMYRLKYGGDPSGSETTWTRKRRVDDLIGEYQAFAAEFVRPDLLAATMLEMAGKLHLWAPVADVAVAQRTLSAPLLDMVLRVVNGSVLNTRLKGLNDDYVWIYLFSRLDCDPSDYEKVLTRFVEAGARGLGMFPFHVETKLPNRDRLIEAALVVREKEKAIAAAAAKADLHARANAYTDYEAETVLMESVEEQTMACIRKAMGTRP